MSIKPAKLSVDDVSNGPERDEARDTIPDRDTKPDEDSGIKEVSAVDRIMGGQRRWYRENNLVISDSEVAKFKFCLALFNMLRREFLKPIVSALLDSQPKLAAEIAPQRRQAYLDYLKLLNKPEYLPNLPPTALVELETIGLISNWDSLASLETIRDQMREILNIPKPDPSKIAK
jgi:hypothetical protein